MVILPLLGELALAAPERTTIEPPVDTELSPAARVTDPPCAESLDPAVTLREPDTPLTASPLVKDTPPVALPLDTPVDTDICPLEPDAPALDVDNDKRPLVAEVLAPVAMITLPPVELVLSPAVNCTLPPACAPVPTDNTISPPAPAVLMPVLIDNPPVDPDTALPL